MIKKIVFTFLFLFAAVPLDSSAQEFIIADKGRREAVTQEQFSLAFGEHAFVDTKKLQGWINRLAKQTYKAPVNAALDDRGEITAAKNGVILDQQTLMEQFYSFFYGETSRTIEVPKKVVYPKVDSELLAEIKTKEIGSFTTYFTENNKERSHNIFLAAKAINNQVVFPGETFSFNKIVGKRTKEKGYKRAPVIVRGELAEDIGGGICQVSSTLFNAVNLHGVQIIERYSHSRRVPYVPPGKDATVSWWGPDFVFKNSYNYPILIRASSGNGQMTVRVFTSENVGGLRK